MMRLFCLLIVFFISTVCVNAHPGHQENAAATFSGPEETTGVSSVESKGLIELAGEFAAMEGRQMRARIFTIEPGGVVGVHTHNHRPGYAYIIEGTIVEHRNDSKAPIVHRPGSMAIEKNGVAHWWENTSKSPVKALVVDIFTAEEK